MVGYTEERVLTRGDDRGDPLYPSSLRFKARRWEKGVPVEAILWNAGRRVARQGGWRSACGAGDTRLGAASRLLGVHAASACAPQDARRHGGPRRRGMMAPRGSAATSPSQFKLRYFDYENLQKFQ
jgi:hypothetical protein